MKPILFIRYTFCINVVKTILSCGIFCILVIRSEAQDSKRALFLGNSYTYYNNLPQLLTDVALSAGDTLVTDSNTPGGTTFSDHTVNSTSLNLIADGNWDYVILQEQSQLPSFPITQVETESFPYAEQLNELILQNNPCAETMFYMTWGRENGDAQNCDFWPPVCTYEGMDDLLRERYLMMAEMNDAEVSPVGAVWRFLRENHPDIVLYASDGSHPSPEGSYAAAVCFYASIFRHDPLNITFDFSIDAEVAADIRNAAHEVVFNNFQEWYIGAYETVSAIEINPLNSLDYSFINTSQFAQSVSLLVEGQEILFTADTIYYTFSNPGNYLVLATATNCGQVVTQEYTVNVISTEIGEKSLPFLIYPNPAADVVMIKTLDAGEVSIYDAMGKRAFSTMVSGPSSIPVGQLPEGIYHLLFNGHSTELMIAR